MPTLNEDLTKISRALDRIHNYIDDSTPSILTPRTARLELEGAMQLLDEVIARNDPAPAEDIVRLATTQAAPAARPPAGDAALLAFMSELEAITSWLDEDATSSEHRSSKRVAYGYVGHRFYQVLQDAGLPREVVTAAVDAGRAKPGWASWAKDAPEEA